MTQLSLIEYDRWCRDTLDKEFDASDKVDKDTVGEADQESGTVTVRVTSSCSAEVRESDVDLVQYKGRPSFGKKPIPIEDTVPKVRLIQKYDSLFKQIPPVVISKTDIAAVTQFLSSKKTASHFGQDLRRVDNIVCLAAKITPKDIRVGEDVEVIIGPFKGVKGRVYFFDLKTLTVRVMNGARQVFDVKLDEVERRMTLYLQSEGKNLDQWGYQRGNIQTIKMGYNPEFIARGILEDYLGHYAGIPGYEDFGMNRGKIEEGRGAYTSVAFMVGHELMHYRYSHALTEVSKSILQDMMPHQLPEYKDSFNDSVYKNVAKERIYHYSEIQNNTYMSQILDVPTVDGSMGCHTNKGGYKIWGYGWLSLKKVNPVTITPEFPYPALIERMSEDEEALTDLMSAIDPSLVPDATAPKRSKKKVQEAKAKGGVPDNVAKWIKGQADKGKAVDPEVVAWIERVSADIQGYDMELSYERQDLHGASEYHDAASNETSVKNPKDDKKVTLTSFVVNASLLDEHACKDAGVAYASVLGLLSRPTKEDVEVGTHDVQDTGDKPEFDDEDLEDPPDFPPPPPPPPGDNPPSPRGYKQGDIVRINSNVTIPGRDPSAKRDGVVTSASTNPDRTQTVTILVDDGMVMKACRHKHPVQDPNPVEVTLNSNQITMSPNQPKEPKVKDGSGDQQQEQNKYKQGQVVKNNQTGEVGVVVGVGWDAEGKIILDVNTDVNAVKKVLGESFELWSKPWPDSFTKRQKEVIHG